MPLRSTRASAIFVLSVLLGSMAQTCAADDEPFSISIQTEGQKLIVVGNNRLAYDPQCDLEIHLGTAEANATKYPSNQMIFSTFKQMAHSFIHPDQSVDLILKEGLLAKASAASVLHSQQFDLDISAAKLTRYGCRLMEKPPEKDQSRPPFDKR